MMRRRPAAAPPRRSRTGQWSWSSCDTRVYDGVQREHANLATGRPATIGQVLPPGRESASSAPGRRRCRLGDLAGEPLCDRVPGW